jgi:large subunit ribosomal protein L15
LVQTCFSTKRQYPPLSLKTLQLLIDTGRIDANKPIDLAAIANSQVFPVNPDFNHFGVNLTDEVLCVEKIPKSVQFRIH